MTLATRLAYCRRQMADHAMSEANWTAWLAEHDGLLVGAGLMGVAECSTRDQTDARLLRWFERGVEDGRLLQAIEKTP